MTLPTLHHMPPEEGAAFIAGEAAALHVLVPDEDRGHERAFWLGFLNALRRRASVGDALRTGGAALLTE